MHCNRNGCQRYATNKVRHNGYSDQAPVTYACDNHAVWWVFGVNGQRIGRISPYYG